jgi:hypothetical protein
MSAPEIPLHLVYHRRVWRENLQFQRTETALKRRKLFETWLQTTSELAPSPPESRSMGWYTPCGSAKLKTRFVQLLKSRTDQVPVRDFN